MNNLNSPSIVEPNTDNDSVLESFCSECLEDTNRSFLGSGECPTCFVDRLDGVLDMMEMRQAQCSKGSNEDITRIGQRIKSKRLFILQTGGTSKKRDSRLFDQLIEALEEFDNVLPDLEDEQEWLPEKKQKA